MNVPLRTLILLNYQNLRTGNRLTFNHQRPPTSDHLTGNFIQASPSRLPKDLEVEESSEIVQRVEPARTAALSRQEKAMGQPDRKDLDV